MKSYRACSVLSAKSLKHHGLLRDTALILSTYFPKHFTPLTANPVILSPDTGSVQKVSKFASYNMTWTNSLLCVQIYVCEPGFTG